MINTVNFSYYYSYRIAPSPPNSITKIGYRIRSQLPFVLVLFIVFLNHFKDKFNRNLLLFLLINLVPGV